MNLTAYEIYVRETPSHQLAKEPIYQLIDEVRLSRHLLDVDWTASMNSLATHLHIYRDFRNTGAIDVEVRRGD